MSKRETSPRLTKAAKRDLADLAAGKDVVPCYGPWVQLRDAGYATGTQWHPVLTDAGRARGAELGAKS